MRLALVAGTSVPELARSVAYELGELEPCTIERFPDGEIGVSIGPVRGADVYLIQTTAPPVHDNFVELLMLADAARRAGAARVTGVIPYLAYARHDRREAEGESVGGRVVAETLTQALDRVIAVDLHTPTLEGFFGCPVEHVSAVPMLAERVRAAARGHVVVAPDLGAVKRAQRFAALLDLEMASVRKRRLSGHEVEVVGIDGDVRGRDVLLADDMISTGATIEGAFHALRAAGARSTMAVATHGLFASPCAARLGALGLEALVVSDSVAIPRDTGIAPDVVTIAPLLADAIGRVYRDAPLAELVGNA